MHPAMERARAVTAKSATARASGDVAVERSGPWEFLVASDARGRELVGPAVSDGEAVAVRRQIEAVSSRTGFAHWWDPALAQAWINRAAELTSDATKARLEGATYEEQCEGVREAWRALSGAYRALNIPWMVDPYAREAYTSRTMGADSRQWCDTGTWGEAARALVPGPFIGTEDGGRGCVQIHNRITLDTNDDVADFMHANEFDRGRWPRWGVTNVGGGAATLNVFDWHAFAWWDECAQRTGIDCERWRSHFFPPAIWSFNLAQEIARSLRNRGPLKVLADSIRATFVINVHSAYDNGTLSRTVGDEAANSLAGAAPLSMAAAHQRDETAADVRGGLEVAGGIVGGAGFLFPPLFIVGALIGLLAEGVRLFDMMFADLRPVQRDLDPWGRDRPVFERCYLTGDGTRGNPPTHAVREPPGFSRAAPPVVLAYIPGMEIVEQSKANEQRRPSSSRGGSGGLLVAGAVALAAVLAVVLSKAPRGTREAGRNEC